MAWKDKIEVKKGTAGEELVDEYLVSEGCFPYVPAVDGAHPFDRIYIHRQQRRAFIVEVKTKPRRKYYDDTGINIRHFDGYVATKESSNLDLWIFFVDEESAKIYGGEIDSLRRPRQIWHDTHGWLEYPLIQKGIVYFPIEAMEEFTNILNESSDAIKAMSSRRYSYQTQADTSVIQP